MKPVRSLSLVAKVFSICLLLISIVNGEESEKRVKMKDLPKAVQATVREQIKGAKLIGLAKEVEDGKTFYEAELKVNGHNKDVLMDTEGAIVEVEEQVTLASLPSQVKEGIEKNAAGGKIVNVESITKNNTLVGYEAHVKKAGKMIEIKVDPQGNLMTGDK